MGFGDNVIMSTVEKHRILVLSENRLGRLLNDNNL